MFEHVPQRKEIKLRTAHEKGAKDEKLSKGKKSGDDAVKDALKIALECLEEAKAEDTITIDIGGKSSIGDYMIVTSGRSNRHVSAICDQLITDMKNAGLGSARTEGLSKGDWVLIDFGDIIIHVFRPEIREFYNIEKMWLAPETDEKTKH
ncbi:ribosome silencing factor [Lentilitoribacter sp. EG35]|uniref:ribosome silencing factor n=1 Tax=Lentilitoribacter sp. EG35 TaxID=3234192 RepID=UPI003B9686BE